MSYDQLATSQNRSRSSMRCDCARSHHGSFKSQAHETSPQIGDRRHLALRDSDESRYIRLATRPFADELIPQNCKDAPNPCRDQRPIRLVANYNSGDRKFLAGQDLFSLGASREAIYNLIEGWVCLYHILEDGQRQILHFALPGAVLGLAMNAAPSTSISAQALTDAVVCIVPHKILGRLLDDDPTLGMRMASQISEDCSLAYDHLTGIGRRSPRERITQLLLELFVRSRSQRNPTNEVHLPLTQEDIGDATGLTFVHVNRVLRDLRRDGILEFRYRRLRIMDPDKLIDAAGVEPQLAASWITRRACG